MKLNFRFTKMTDLMNNHNSDSNDFLSKVEPMFVQETPAGPNEHPLEHTFVFSYFFKPKAFNPEEYSQYVQPVAAVNSVEQFWNVYSYLQRPQEFEKGSDFKTDLHFFKKGIKPVWEDPNNVNGGKWILRVKKGLSNRLWENLLLAIIGEQFLVGDEICGAVCSIRNQEDIISLWSRNANEKGAVNRIREALPRLLSLPDNAVLEYKLHNDCLKDQSSYRFANYTNSRRV